MQRTLFTYIILKIVLDCKIHLEIGSDCILSETFTRCLVRFFLSLIVITNAKSCDNDRISLDPDLFLLISHLTLTLINFNFFFRDVGLNDLIELPGRPFQTLWKLQDLLLDRNEIKYLSAELFTGLQNLQIL